MQEDVRQSWARQLVEQRRSDGLAVVHARAVKIGDATFDQVVQATADKLGKVVLTPREMGRMAPQWNMRATKAHQNGSSSTAGDYDKALAEAEAALHAHHAAELGEEWLEVYSDASVQLGSQSSEDRSGVGVWVAHKARTEGA